MLNELLLLWTKLQNKTILFRNNNIHEDVVVGGLKYEKKNTT